MTLYRRPAAWLLFLLCLLPTALSAAPVTLAVMPRGALPGFRAEDAALYLTQQMAVQNLPDWAFIPAPAPPYPPRNRIEWHFALDPYASGGVRQYFPMPQVQKLFGARHRVTAEAMLYLDDEYQTLVFGQATIQGGAQDKDLAAFIAAMTQNLLGPHGAYRSIDLAPPANAPAP